MPTTAGKERRYWLFKSEPSSFSWGDLWKAKGRRTGWDGVRNYQARNFLRDSVQVGDGVLFYHSSCEPNVIAGICKVVRAGYPDPTAAEEETGTWFAVEVEAVRAFVPAIERARLLEEGRLAGMEVLRKGSRLSVQVVRGEEWRCVLELGGVEGELW